MEETKDLSFSFVRVTLIVILLLIGVLAVILATLGWKFSFASIVEGHGYIQPRNRHLVRSKISGLIHKIYVVHAQQIEIGDTLLVLDDSEWRNRIRRVSMDLEINNSEKNETIWKIEQEKSHRQAEILRAKLEVDRLNLELERIEKELSISSGYSQKVMPLKRKPFNQLLPIRLAHAEISKQQTEIELAKEHASMVFGLDQQINTLDKERNKLNQELANLREKVGYCYILSPKKGIVVNRDLSNRIGESVQAGGLILEIVEPNNGWEARITIAEKNIPKVKIGQIVMLLLEAFPYQEHRIFEGQVEDVSTKPLVNPALRAKEYEVIIGIFNLENSMNEVAVSYGMSVEARILIEKNRVADLVIGKLFGTTVDLKTKMTHYFSVN